MPSPPRPPSAPAAPRQAAAPIAPAQSPPAAPPATTTETPRQGASDDTQQADRPASAELHLDGAALGRWVTRHLERQVTRPQAGATGFDPRMSPSWAGAPIGN
jgi:hypothetical protein